MPTRASAKKTNVEKGTKAAKGATGTKAAKRATGTKAAKGGTKGGAVVCYTGIGAKASGLHTEAEFLTRLRPHCSRDCPTDLNSWIEWSGAVRTAPTECKRMVQQNKRIGAANRNAGRADKAFDRCVDGSMCSVYLVQAAEAQHMEPRRVMTSFARCAAVECPKASARLAAMHTKARMEENRHEQRASRKKKTQ
jgi:hypothetical protein